MARQRRWVVAVGLLALAAMGAETPDAVIDVLGDGQAQINWTTGQISATGLAGPQRGRKSLPLQRRVAMVDAYRQLAEAVKGVRVTSETTVEMYELVDDSIATELDTFLKGQQIVDEGWLDDQETYRVTLTVPLRAAEGGSSLTRISVPRATQETEVVNIRVKSIDSPEPPVRAVDVPEDQPPLPDDFPTDQKGPFTGLVLDCRGFDLKRAMSPKILTEDEDEVWGTVAAVPEEVLDKGIVGYLPNLAMALDPEQSRAGKNPLVVRIIGRQGSFRANAVVSDDDAKRILDTDHDDKYLKDYKVVFVIGELPEQKEE